MHSGEDTIRRSQLLRLVGIGAGAAVLALLSQLLVGEIGLGVILWILAILLWRTSAEGVTPAFVCAAIISFTFGFRALGIVVFDIEPIVRSVGHQVTEYELLYIACLGVLLLVGYEIGGGSRYAKNAKQMNLASSNDQKRVGRWRNVDRWISFIGLLVVVIAGGVVLWEFTEASIFVTGAEMDAVKILSEGYGGQARLVFFNSVVPLTAWMIGCGMHRRKPVLVSAVILFCIFVLIFTTRRGPAVALIGLVAVLLTFDGINISRRTILMVGLGLCVGVLAIFFNRKGLEADLSILGYGEFMTLDIVIEALRAASLGPTGAALDFIQLPGVFVWQAEDHKSLGSVLVERHFGIEDWGIVPTLFGYCIVAFGKLGAPIATLVWGVVMGYVWWRCRVLKMSRPLLAFLIVSYLTIFTFYFVRSGDPLLSGFVINKSIILGLLLYLMRGAAVRAGKKTMPVRRV